LHEVADYSWERLFSFQMRRKKKSLNLTTKMDVYLSIKRILTIVAW